MIRKLLSGILTPAFWVGWFCWGVLAIGLPQSCKAVEAPTANYYNNFGMFYDGDYRDALRAFQSESRGSIKTSQSRWIDSICYETMCGECYYQMGRFDEALQCYTNALDVYARFPDWMAKVQFHAAIRDAGVGARKAVPWGVSMRKAKLGAYPSTELLYQGNIDQTATAQQGGVMQQANTYSVSPQEIVRCTTLALRRRAALLGPAAKYDSLSNNVVAAMSRNIGPANHWSGAWVDLERSLASMAVGKEGNLIRCVLAGGEFDHPMTGVALLELGRQAAARNDYPAAMTFFAEATYAAVNTYSSNCVPDYGTLEEAFHCAAVTHLMSNHKDFFKPLESAIQWAKVKNLRQLRASLLISAAENYAVIGETRRAVAALNEARGTIGNRIMGGGAIGARLSYVAALVAFQQGRVPEGNAALKLAMNYMQHGSLWLYHIRLADNLYINRDATPRAALDLFGDVLNDPQPRNWAEDPMESLAVLCTPCPGPMEHWFEASLEGRAVREVHTAIEIADRIRRRRFFDSMEFGGRLESLRWILEAPAIYLPVRAKLQRQDLLARFPKYQELSQQAQAIRDTLSKQPLSAADPTEFRAQSKQMAELAAIGAKQEAIVREIALRREPADMVFPPLRTVADVQKTMQEKHAAMVFFATSRRMYGFLINNERCACWEIDAPLVLLKQMQTMLRDMGQYGANHEMTVKDVSDAKWKQSAAQTLKTLLANSPADLSQSFNELVIVPDGILWYLPFEALQTPVGGELQSLISRFHIRYSPTLSLCTSPGPGHSSAVNTAVVLGKLYPHDDNAVAQKAFAEFAKVVPGAEAVRVPAPAPSSIYSILSRQLVVFDDVPGPEKTPYDWNPEPVERGKSGNTLDDWLLLPWGGPDVVVLPGYHTASEEALRHIRRELPGNEMFLSVCGLMANGSRTLLMSRWRTGGQTSYDLVREFTQELPRTPPADAWQRAVLLAMDSRLNLEAEPRIKRSASDDPPKAVHPFFWAGYMLVDCGDRVEPTPNEPATKPKKADRPPVPNPPGNDQQIQKHGKRRP
jgi:CHAT domain-containing protein